MSSTRKLGRRISAPPTPNYDHIEAFREAMRMAGIDYRGPIEADGKLHRFHVEGDSRGKRNGWYVLHLDEHPAGMFGWSPT